MIFFRIFCFLAQLCSKDDLLPMVSERLWWCVFRRWKTRRKERDLRICHSSFRLVFRGHGSFEINRISNDDLPTFLQNIYRILETVFTHHDPVLSFHPLFCEVAFQLPSKCPYQPARFARFVSGRTSGGCHSTLQHQILAGYFESKGPQFISGLFLVDGCTDKICKAIWIHKASNSVKTGPVAFLVGYDTICTSPYYPLIADLQQNTTLKHEDYIVPFIAFQLFFAHGLSFPFSAFAGSELEHSITHFV